MANEVSEEDAASLAALAKSPRGGDFGQPVARARGHRRMIRAVLPRSSPFCVSKIVTRPRANPSQALALPRSGGLPSLTLASDAAVSIASIHCWVGVRPVSLARSATIRRTNVQRRAPRLSSDGAAGGRGDHLLQPEQPAERLRARGSARCTTTSSSAPAAAAAAAAAASGSAAENQSARRATAAAAASRRGRRRRAPPGARCGGGARARAAVARPSATARARARRPSGRGARGTRCACGRAVRTGRRRRRRAARRAARPPRAPSARA